MRITNNMITANTKTNINSNKLLVDKYNTQMTTQKKIAKASEDPVIAIRSLRLSTSLSHINQYVENNIPDSSAWMDVTETALTNMKDLLTDIRSHCVNGSTDTLSTEDRQTILDALTALSEQVYAEGNADYAGKTVFTGYRTSSNLTFDEEELDTTYEIDQTFTFADLEEKRYYTGDVQVPETVTVGNADPALNTTECDTQIIEKTYERIRLAYGGDTELETFGFTYAADPDTTVKIEATPVVQADGSYADEYTVKAYELDANGEYVLDANGDRVEVALPQNITVKAHETEQAWEDATGVKEVGDYDIVYIKETGEFVFGKEIANDISDSRSEISATYTKKGFDEGDLRPEYYYDCRDITDDDASKHITYTKQNQDINYTIANNTTITINTQADTVFDTSIARDVEELINVVQKAINAEAKVEEIKNMMDESQYQDDASQAILQGYLDAAEKEADFAADNLQKTFENYIGNFDGYLETVNIAITNVGSVKNSLTLTQTRVENQQMTLEELKSDNEDRDISDIIIDYYASYNAYTASLTAAGKLGQQTLLNYI